MFSLIDRGYLDTQAWGEIRAAVEQRRKLVESERKRLIEVSSVSTMTGNPGTWGKREEEEAQ